MTSHPPAILCRRGAPPVGVITEPVSVSRVRVGSSADGESPSDRHASPSPSSTARRAACAAPARSPDPAKSEPRAYISPASATAGARRGTDELRRTAVPVGAPVRIDLSTSDQPTSCAL